MPHERKDVGMYGGLSIYYLIPLILSPLLAGFGGWMTAFFQYRSQRANLQQAGAAQLAGDYRQELQALRTELDKLKLELTQTKRTVRDVFVQMIEHLDDVSPNDVKDNLFVLVRQGLKEV